MRKLTRGVVVGALAAPLLMIASAGVASADESSYCKQTTTANEQGASSESVCNRSQTDGNHDKGGYRNHGLLGGGLHVGLLLGMN